MTIGDRIKNIRTAADIAQTTLAKQIQSTKQTLYKYENNIITNIPSDKIEKLATALNVSPAYLMGWDDEGTESTEDYTFTADGEVIYHNKQIIIKDEWPEEMKTEILNFMQYVKTKYNVE